MIDSNWRVTLPPGTRRHPAGLNMSGRGAYHAGVRMWTEAPKHLCHRQGGTREALAGTLSKLWM
jgi:hypothetical protein